MSDRPIKTGRPTKMTPEVLGSITGSLSSGNTRKASAAIAGISESTFQNWLKDPAFLASVLKAESVAVIGMVAVIHKAAKKGDWKAAAWWLERRAHGFHVRDEIEERLRALEAKMAPDPERGDAAA